MTISNLHHSFDVRLAAEHGLEEAILIHHFQYWITLNKNMNRNFREGRTWTYQTRKFIAASFPYLNERNVKYACKNLEKKGILICKNLNKSHMDKTLWYAFVDENKFISQHSNNVYERQNCPSMDKIVPSIDKIVPPIPDTISISSISISDDDDLERGCGNVHNIEGHSIKTSTVEKAKPNGQKVQCSQEEYFKYCVNTRKDFKTEEILDAWSRFTECKARIGDWMKYIDQIIINKRQGEKSCSTQKHNEENKTIAKKNISESFKENTSETTSKELPSARVRLPFEPPNSNRLVNGLKPLKTFWS